MFQVNISVARRTSKNVRFAVLNRLQPASKRNSLDGGGEMIERIDGLK
jgi:hypothetical protein